MPLSLEGFGQAVQLTPREQNDGLLWKLARDGAWEKALIRLKELRPSAVSVDASNGVKLEALAISGGSAAEQRRAAFVGQRLAAVAARDPNILTQRTWLIGRPEPFSPEEAWQLLDSVAAVSAQGSHFFLFPDQKGGTRSVRVSDESSLGGLWVWAHHVSLFYGWDESEAAWFLLTGRAPPLVPVTGRINGAAGQNPLFGTIAVTAAACASPEAVAATFAKGQRILLGARRGPLPILRLIVAAFVDEVTTRQRKRPPESVLQDEWRRIAPPEWRRLRRSMGRHYHEQCHGSKTSGRRRNHRRDS